MNDPIGHQTLEAMSEANYYNKWIYSHISKYISGDVAEIGAGTGTFSNIIANAGYTVTAIDYNLKYLKIIKEKSSDIDTVLFDMQSQSLQSKLIGKFDSIIILNVLEHLSSDKLAISHLYDMLKKNGTLIILVPSFQFAYGSLDKNLGHFRRYSKSSLIKLVSEAKFKMIKCYHINPLGLLGWTFNSRILKKKSISLAQVKLFDLISRPFLTIEKYIPIPIGLSVICIARKI